MSDNPYASPQTSYAAPAWSYERLTVTIVVGLALLFLVGGLLQFVAIFLWFLGEPFQSVGEFLMPRFGWIGLIIGTNTAWSLFTWYRKRERRQLLIAAGNAMLAALLNAGQRLYLMSALQPVAGPPNPFTERHPWFWIYAVASYAITAVIVLWLWWLQPTSKAGEKP